VEVELEDGTIITDVPEGTTQTELMRRLGLAKEASNASPDSTQGKWYRGLGLGTRDVLEGTFKAVGAFSDPIAAFGNKALEAVGSDKRMSTAGGVGKAIADSMDLPNPQNATERVFSDINQAGAGVLTTMGAGTLPQVSGRVAAFLTDDLAVQLGSAAGGATAGGVTRESGGGKAAQIAASVAGGIAGGGLVSAVRSPGDDSARLLLDPKKRQAALDTEDIELHNTLRTEYKNATTPFDAEYQKLVGVTSSHSEFSAVSAANRNAIDFDPTVSAAVGRVSKVLEDRAAKNIPLDANTLKDARSYLLGVSRETRNPNTSRVLNQMADGLQSDIDNALLSTAARGVSSRYANEVVGPWARIRKSLDASSDPEDVWKAIKTAGRSDLERLSDALPGPARDVVRRRVIREIVERESAYTGMQAGSGAPAYRQMDSRGLGVFFTPKEWRGLKQVTSRLAALKNPFTRLAAPGSAAVVGGTFGGPLGAITSAGGVALAEFLASTNRGRLFLETAIRTPFKELDRSLLELSRNPGLLHGINATDVEEQE